jgi:hypothetical protein
MSTQQPEALRLADELTTPHMEVNREAAAELRRLHDVELHLAQVERGFDKLITQRDALHSVNAELLGALQSIMEMTGGYVPDTSKGEWAKARAAIAKATGEQA